MSNGQNSNSKLLEQYSKIVKQLMLHTSEENCKCTVRELLSNLELE